MYLAQFYHFFRNADSAASCFRLLLRFVRDEIGLLQLLSAQTWIFVVFSSHFQTLSVCEDLYAGLLSDGFFGLVPMHEPAFLRSWIREADDVKISQQFTPGCYGTSFKAKLKGVQCSCSVKYLNAFVSDDVEREFWSALVRVAETGHCNIVPLVGIVNCGGASVITEYERKGTLAAACAFHRATKHWPVGMGEVRLSCIFYGIANALNFLHGIGLVHGDLKPTNVCLGEGHRPFLTDFGYRGVILPREEVENLSKEEILYLAPELLVNRGESQNATEATDIYAFGMILYTSLLEQDPIILSGGQSIDDERFTSELLIGEIVRGNRPRECSHIPGGYWSIITKCWAQNQVERPSASDLLEYLEEVAIFGDGKKRRLGKQYLDYISEMKNSTIGLREDRAPREIYVGSRQSYTEAVAFLSDEIVRAGVSVKEVKTSISQHVFKCKSCRVTYRLTKNFEDDTTWDVYVTGVHGHETGSGRPLVLYLKMCIAEGLDRGLSGTSFLKFVRDKTNAKLPASTIYYHMAKNPRKDWQALWRRIPCLVDRLESAGLRCEKFFRQTKDVSVFESLIFELPGMRFCLTDAFIKLVFVDGCHLNDRLRSTLLSMATITADHIIIPIVAMICPSENKESYERLFRFVKRYLPHRFTIMSDQSKSMIPAFDDVFGHSATVKRLPCFFHICKSFTAEVRWELKQVLTCDHKDAYSVMLECFDRDHHALFQSLKEKVIDTMSYMSNKYDGVFEMIADSSIESLNAAILDLRSREPLELIEGLVTFTNDQLERQIGNVRSLEGNCQACSNIISARKAKARDLSCRKTKGKFVVTEKFVTGVMVEYDVQRVDDVLVCQCNGYQRLGIPCRHLYAVCHKFPKKQKYLPRIWAMHQADTIVTAARESQVTVNVADLKEDETVNLRAPMPKPGRPRKKRFRTYREYLATTCTKKCSACGKVGHTKRSNRCELRRDKQTTKRRAPTLRETVASRLIEQGRAKSVEPVRPPLILSPVLNPNELT